MLNEEMFNRYDDTRDLSLRNRIVEKYLYMVDILIRKYLNKGVEYDDLYQVGAMALVAAVERFDPGRGFEFTSFATPTILGEIKKHFRDKEWSVKVPRRLKEISSKLYPAKDELFSKLQRNPTISELAEFIGVSEEEVIRALESSKAYDSYSLNQTFDESGEDGDRPVLERFAAIEEKGYSSFEYAEVIRSVLRTLSDTDKYIFQKRFIKNKTQTEIAAELGVSQMTVSRSERSIKKKFADELLR